MGDVSLSTSATEKETAISAAKKIATSAAKKCHVSSQKMPHQIPCELPRGTICDVYFRHRYWAWAGLSGLRAIL